MMNTEKKTQDIETAYKLLIELGDAVPSGAAEMMKAAAVQALGLGWPQDLARELIDAVGSHGETCERLTNLTDKYIDLQEKHGALLVQKLDDLKAEAMGL